MFIKNYAGNLINTAHIVTVCITAPMYEQKDHRVVANLTYGTAILFRGTEDKCKTYMENFAAIVNTAALNQNAEN